jgi:hypothetical protein
MEIKNCKYCGSELKKINLPVDSDFNVPYLFACFNDECGYYVRGWEWMRKNYNATASYRYKYNPFLEDDGPLPVASPYSWKEMLDDSIQ